MIIKNLTQLKRAIEARTPFLIVEHYVHPESKGQIRVPNVVQTNGFYSVVKDDDKNEINSYNNGKGSWMPYGKARENWMFDGDCITAVQTKRKRSWSDNGRVYYDYWWDEKVMIIKFLDEGDKESV